MRLASKRCLPKIALIVLLIGGTAIRLDFARHAVPFGDDYGTAALMSKHIVEGREFPLYFYGYRYIGALGAYVGALMFALFGQSLFSLCLAMIPFSMLWVFATYLLFRRLINEWAGVLAAAVVAFPPPVLLEYSTVPLLGYPTTFAFGTLLLYFGVRLKDRDLGPRAEWFYLLGMAAVAALAIWTNPISIPYLLVAFGLLVAHVVRSRLNRRLIVKLGVAFVVFVVALLPAIVTAHRQGPRAMFGHWPGGLRFIPRSVPVFVSKYIPDQLYREEHVPRVVAWLVWASYALLGAGFVTGVTVAAMRRDRTVLRAAVVPVAFVLAFLLLFLANSKTLGGLPRYFTPFYLGVVACVVFPLAYRRTWLGATAALIASFLVAYNIAATLVFVHGERGRMAAENNAAIEELVAVAKAKGLRHVMIQSYYGQAMTFAAGEDVVFVRTTKERHYPYAVRAAADDDAGFAKPNRAARSFEKTLQSLGITDFDSFSAGGWTVFHDIKLPTDRLRLVEPVAASIIAPDGAVTDAGGLIDRHDETIPGERFESAASLVVDFGRQVEIAAARFVTPAVRDYPVGFTFLGSDNGSDWRTIQHVEEREALTCITGNRLDHWSHCTSMECRFEPASLRYFKMAGCRSASPNFKVWRFQEVYFYARDGQDGLPDGQEATEIARKLKRLGIELVVADEWLSRTIELTAGPHPEVVPRWEFRFPASHVSRVVPIRRGVAVVVETAHAERCGERLADATLGDVGLARHDFAHYTAYVIKEAPRGYELFPGLRWNGFTLTGTARIATADWYHRRGKQLESAARHDDARRYFRCAFDTFPGIRANLKRLAPHDEEARAMLATLTPEFETRCRFPHGVSLVGYTLVPSPLVPGKPATLRLVWQLEGRVKHDFIQVFVHFLAGKRRLFQADHNATFPVAPGSTVPPALVLNEHEFLVPKDIPAGVLTIRLGATSVADRSVRLKPRTNLKTRSRAVEIGRAKLVRAGVVR